jgi:folylpolyglutamate synthase
MDFYGNAAGLNDSNSSRTSSVFESLPLAIKWLRETAQQNQSIQFQVKAYATISIMFSQMFHST